MKYIVPILYKGLSNYIVEADHPDEAKEKAKSAYVNSDVLENDALALLGNEYEEIETFGTVEPLPEEKEKINRDLGEHRVFGDTDVFISDPNHEGKKYFTITRNGERTHLPEDTVQAILEWGKGNCETDILAAEGKWLGIRVRQVRCDSLEYQHMVGREGTVSDVKVDEKGNVHCGTEPDGIWCPARLLEKI